jgi:hypothetical protein
MAGQQLAQEYQKVEPVTLGISLCTLIFELLASESNDKLNGYTAVPYVESDVCNAATAYKKTMHSH